MAGFAGTLRSSYDRLQSLRPVGRTRDLEWNIRGARHRMRGRLDLRGQFHCEGAPLGGRRKRGELGQGIGRSRGGRGSKVHVAVDDFGRPLRIDVTGAQTHDSKAFDAFLDWDAAPLAIVAPSRQICFANRLSGNGQGLWQRRHPPSHR